MKEKKEGREGRTSEIDLDDEWGRGRVQEGDDGFRFARVGAEGLSKYAIDRRHTEREDQKSKARRSVSRRFASHRSHTDIPCFVAPTRPSPPRFDASDRTDLAKDDQRVPRLDVGFPSDLCLLELFGPVGGVVGEEGGGEEGFDGDLC